MTKPQDLANAIKELRGRRTQKEAADRAGIPPSTWSGYEKGDRWPRSRGRYGMIAKGLEVDEMTLGDLALEHRKRRMAEEGQTSTGQVESPTTRSDR